MNLFLKAKHWQLFAAFYGILVFIQIMYPVFFYNIIVNNYEPELDTMLQFLILFGVLAIVSTIAMYGWIISVSLGLEKVFPENIDYNKKYFKIYLISLFVSVFVVIVSAVLLALSGEFIDQSPLFGIIMIIVMLVILMPLSLYMTFCQIYVTLYAARSYKTCQLQREVRFKECIGVFFLFYFSMVGVWILQPKINKFYESISEE